MDNTDIKINGNIATWVMPLTEGEYLGSYKGAFEFFCYLSPTQQLEAGREFRAFVGSQGASASETELNLAYALSQLKFRIKSAPPFWNATKQDSSYAGDIPDLNIIMLVLKAADRAEELFKEILFEERQALLERSLKAAEEILKKENDNGSP